MRAILPPTHALALMRTGFGLYFLASAYDATRNRWLATGLPLQDMLRLALPHAAPGYGRFLLDLVIPHADLFARLITLIDFAVGLSLLLGFLTPLAALGGIGLSLQYLLLEGLPHGAGAAVYLFVLGELIVSLSAAGLVWGLDGILWHRPSPMVLNRGYPTSALPYSASTALRLRARVHGRG